MTKLPSLVSVLFGFSVLAGCGSSAAGGYYDSCADGGTCPAGTACSADGLCVPVASSGGAQGGGGAPGGGGVGATGGGVNPGGGGGPAGGGAPGGGGVGATGGGGVGGTGGGFGGTGGGVGASGGVGGTGGGSTLCPPDLIGQQCTALGSADPVLEACIHNTCCFEVGACLSSSTCAPFIACANVCLGNGGTAETCGQQCSPCVDQAGADLYTAMGSCLTDCTGN